MFRFVLFCEECWRVNRAFGAPDETIFFCEPAQQVEEDVVGFVFVGGPVERGDTGERQVQPILVPQHDAVLDAAAAHGVESALTVKPRVPYRHALALQMEADVLLLLQSSDPRDEGNLPAKLFEYLYARRPILFIGYERGIAARLVIERSAGLVSNSPVNIRDQLHRWYEDKRAGRLDRLDPSVSLGLGRDDQYAKLERLFEEILESQVSASRRLPLGEANAIN